MCSITLVGERVHKVFAQIGSKSGLVARMAEWLRRLIFSALNRSSSHRWGSSLAQVTCETSQILLADGQVVFLRDLTFQPFL